MSEVPGAGWHDVGKASDYEDEDVEQARVGDLTLAVYKVRGEFYATDDVCTHEHAFLSDGVVVDDIVECPMHQGRFHIPTGKALGAPVVTPLGAYPVKVVEDRIYVQVAGKTET